MGKDELLRPVIGFKLSLPCPACGRVMVVYGHDNNSWHADAEGKGWLQKFYVSCTCGTMLSRTHSLNYPREALSTKPGGLVLVAETKAIPLDQLSLEGL